MKDLLKTIGINVGVLLILLLLLEGVLWLFFPAPDPYLSDRSINKYISSSFPPHFQAYTTPENGLPGVVGKKKFTINQMGFRGDSMILPKPKNEYRVFMIGGSTTECFFLDDTEAITAVLQKELQALSPDSVSIKVMNAGKSGDASPDHISMLSNRITHLQPDMIVLFAGFNDLSRSLEGYDYRHYHSGIVTLYEFRLVFAHSQVFRRLYYLYMQLNRDQKQALQTITYASRIRKLSAIDRSFPAVAHPPKVDVTSYRENLTTLAGIAKAHNVKFVMMTQMAIWNNTLGEKHREWLWLLRGHREKDMAMALDSLNQQMYLVAQTQNVPLFELNKVLTPSLQYFYDDCHFNTNGAKVAGKSLAAFLHTVK